MLAVELIYRLNRIAQNAEYLSKMVARDACMERGKTPKAEAMRVKFWRAITLDAKALDGNIAIETHERAAERDGN